MVAYYGLHKKLEYVMHCYEHLKSRTFQRSNKFEESLIQIARVWEANRHMLRQHFNTQEEFFEEIIKKSYNPNVNNQVIIPDLLRIADYYEQLAPNVSFDGSKELNATASIVTNPFHLAFNKLNSSAPMCTQGVCAQSLASLQDAADPFTHYVFVYDEYKNLVQQIQLLECKARNLETGIENEYVLVEGVYGSPEDRFQLSDYHEYALKLIFDFVNQINKNNNTQKGLLVNKSQHCSDKSQIEAIEFVDRLYSSISRKPLYVQESLGSKTLVLYEDIPNFSIEPITLENNPEVRNRLKFLLEKENVFINLELLLTLFSKDLRYLDTTYTKIDNKSKKRKEKKRLVEGWNPRVGIVSVIPFEAGYISKICGGIQ